MKVTNIQLAEHLGVSEGTIRKWIKNDPIKYKTILNQYIFEKRFGKGKKAVAMLNFKGGVGKSTIANILQPCFKNAAILNVDLAQNAQKFNSGTTYNMLDIACEDETISVDEVLEILFEKHDTVIIDTPGETTPEVAKVLQICDNFIIPYQYNPRVLDTTVEKTLEVAFGEDTFAKEGIKQFAFICNVYREDKEAELGKKAIESELKNIKLDREFIANYSSLRHTTVLNTMEFNGSNIDELAEKNPFAYKVAQKRFHSLTKEIASSFNIETTF